VLGKQIELLVEDDHNEASEAASAVSSLITRDHVVALIGENASSRSLPRRRSPRTTVPMVSPSSTNVAVTEGITSSAFAYRLLPRKGVATSPDRP
jgi:branched-chain amino acid transport system substrate-binding protein